MLENKFKSRLSKEIEKDLEGSMVLHLDPCEKQGIPDLIILYKGKYACLEGKKSSTSSVRPNQEYYVNKINNDAFASFIYPENKDIVLSKLYEYFERGTNDEFCF